VGPSGEKLGRKAVLKVTPAEDRMIRNRISKAGFAACTCVALNICGLAHAASAREPGASAAPAFPAKSVRFVVPFSAGGPTDILARVIGQKLTAAWGQQVIVDNRAGAGSTLGTDIVAKAEPDGHTLLMTTSGHAINPALYRKLPFDSVRDFAPITLVNSAPLMLVTHPSVAAKSVKELIALARAKPGQLNYASSGSGGISHLAGHLFMTMSGIEITHVPHKGMAPAVGDAIGGQVQMVFPDPLVAMPHVKAGKLRGLGITGTKRLQLSPEIPTIAEAGVPGYDVTVWYGVLAPGRTPIELVKRLHAEISRAVNTPDLRERLINEGGEPTGNTPEQFAAIIRADLAKWARVVKDAGVRLD
jgi:tripartite-type tricarboxylate transporter receptor subunit TctC